MERLPADGKLICPERGAAMLIREGPRGRFLGCSAYPKCKSTQELPNGFQVPVASEQS